MEIFEYFPYPELRPSQKIVLQWVQDNWSRYDVFVLQCPVAAGKSPLALTIANWARGRFGMSGRLTTPDNVLVRQYQDDFKIPGMPLRAKYASQEAFEAARSKAKEQPLLVMNNWSLLANRAYGALQIFDEAHTLIPMLQDFEGITWWNHLDPFSPEGKIESLRGVADAALYFQSIVTDTKKVKNLTKQQAAFRTQAKAIVKAIAKNANDFVLAHETKEYQGVERKCFRVYPLTPRGNAPILWPPSKVKKIVLMSATIGRPDVHDLGLDGRRVGYIEVPSDIPKERRPVYYQGVGSLGRGKTAETVDKVISRLVHLQQTRAGRGFVHATYGLAAEMDKKLDKSKFITHTKIDKNLLWDRWRSGSDVRTFVGCGMTTGINMKGDIANWQAILKCPFPDLGDTAVRGKYLVNEEWYAWTTIKQILQAYGRVCRGPEDYGATFILDSDFLRLYDRWNHLWPQWFKEAMTSNINGGAL